MKVWTEKEEKVEVEGKQTIGEEEREEKKGKGEWEQWRWERRIELGEIKMVVEGGEGRRQDGKEEREEIEKGIVEKGKEEGRR